VERVSRDVRRPTFRLKASPQHVRGDYVGADDCDVAGTWVERCQNALRPLVRRAPWGVWGSFVMGIMPGTRRGKPLNTVEVNVLSAGRLISVGVGDVADKLSPGHVQGSVDPAGFGPPVVLEDFHHQGRVIRDDERIPPI
jgi:hypothetical protein